MEENQIEKINLDKVDWRGSREFFESLGEALDKLDDKDESYDFTWVGKRKAIIEAGAPINKTFRPDVENSKNWDTTENLFIEGDNLDALKLLQESYLGKVKMIYIDPPYNTGKDFVYHDNFKASVEEYDEATEYKDESGNIQFKKNEKSNGRYHSDWLSMMYPRLKLARNLMSDDGVLFISIGIDELANLKKLCDEILSSENFLYQLSVVNKLNGNDNSSGMMETEEYCLIYARNKEIFEMGVLPLEEDDASDWLIDDHGYWKLGGSLKATGINAPKSARPNLFYSVYINEEDLSFSLEEDSQHKYKLTPITDGEDMSWYWSKNKMINEYFDVIVKKVSGGYSLYKKQRPQLGDLPSKRGKTTFYNPRYSTANSNSELKDLFDGKKVFDYSKSVALMKDFISLANTKSDDIIMDFFAGSSTLAEAVLRINSEDKEKRKYIMITYPEDLDLSLLSASIESRRTIQNAIELCDKIGMPHNLTEISKERIRRSGDKIATENTDVKVDLGFRSLVITDTNYKDVYKSAGETEQAKLLEVVDNVKSDRTPLDLLYGILTQSALELNRPLETRKISGADTFLYDYFGEISGLVACFDESISEDTIKEIAKLKPLTAVFRETSFHDSQAKVNLAEHFRILSPDTKIKVI